MSGYSYYTGFWDDPEVNEVVLQFLRDRAFFPRTELEALKKRLRPALNMSVKTLAQRGIVSRWKLAGSVSEGVCIVAEDGSLEVDVDYLMDEPNLHVSRPGEPGCCVQINAGWGLEGYTLPPAFFDGHGRVSAELALSEYDHAFDSVVSYWQDTFQGCVVHEKKGPAEKVTISRKGRPWLSVDNVPKLRVVGEGQFVAKQRDYGKKRPFYWRESFSDLEKAQYPSHIDKPFAKGCLRVLKAFAKRREELKKLDSYMLKNVLFLELEERPWDEWQEEDVARRVIGLLARLRRALWEGYLPQFFSPETNLLRKVSTPDQKDMRDFINRLLHDPNEFIEAFSV